MRLTQRQYKDGNDHCPSLESEGTCLRLLAWGYKGLHEWRNGGVAELRRNACLTAS